MYGNAYLVLLLAAVPARARVYRTYGAAGCLWSGDDGSGAEGGDEKKFVENLHRARVWGGLRVAAMNGYRPVLLSGRYIYILLHKTMGVQPHGGM